MTGSMKRSSDEDAAVGPISSTSLSRHAGGIAPADVQSLTNIAGANLSPLDRLYEEYEYERRLKRRRARLATTTEEAFNNIRRAHQTEMLDQQQQQQRQYPVMDPYEAAQAVFSSIARDLRRYLRLTRQHPYFAREHIVAHLANCIAYDLSPKAFLKKFIGTTTLQIIKLSEFNGSDSTTLICFIMSRRREHTLQ